MTRSVVRVLPAPPFDSTATAVSLMVNHGDELNDPELVEGPGFTTINLLFPIWGDSSVG